MSAPLSHPVLFLHGGPGLHSEAERRALTPLLEARGIRMGFWNEPSYLRGPAPARAPGFARSLDSASAAIDALRAESDGRSVHLIGHSFGALLSLALIRRDTAPSSASAGRIASVTLVNPALNLNETLRGVIARAQRDSLAAGRTELAEAFALALARSRSPGDAELRQAFNRAFAEHPEILSYYWHNSAALAEWGAIMAEPEFGIDWQAQADVMESVSEPVTWLGSAPLGLPVRLIFGMQDRVSRYDLEFATLSAIAHPLSVTELHESAHFPHLEERATFVDALHAFLESAEATVAKARRSQPAF